MLGRPMTDCPIFPIAALRDGAFVNRERLGVYPLLLVIGFAAALCWLFATAHGLSDYKGRPLGSDFSSFYAAGRLALSGHAAFTQAELYRSEQAIFGDRTPYYAFAYPPIFLLVAAPLATLPYLPALLAWQLGGLAFYVAAMTALRRRWGADLPGGAFFPAVLAFPAVFVNLLHGQNGFLTAGLCAFALALLEERPLAAGIGFGLLAFKPQFGLLIPFVLAADGRWRSFAAAAAAVLTLVLASTNLFSVESWRSFFAAMQFARHAILDRDAVGYEKMVSPFAALRLWGAPLGLAYGGQALASLAVLALSIRLWRRTAGMRCKGAALCLGMLIATPFALDYDLMLLAPAILLMAAEGEATGFRPFEKTLLVFLWLMPFATRGIAEATHIPLALAGMLPAFVLVWRRAGG